MRKIINLLMACGVVLSLTSCGGPSSGANSESDSIQSESPVTEVSLTPKEVSLKLDKHETLNSKDYDVILSYLEEYYSKLDEISAKLMSEDNSLEKLKLHNESLRIDNSYSYKEQFANALKNAYGHLSHEQELRFKDLGDNANRNLKKLQKNEESQRKLSPQEINMKISRGESLTQIDYDVMLDYFNNWISSIENLANEQLNGQVQGYEISARLIAIGEKYPYGERFYTKLASDKSQLNSSQQSKYDRIFNNMKSTLSRLQSSH